MNDTPLLRSVHQREQLPFDGYDRTTVRIDIVPLGQGNALETVNSCTGVNTLRSLSVSVALDKILCFTASRRPKGKHKQLFL